MTFIILAHKTDELKAPPPPPPPIRDTTPKQITMAHSQMYNTSLAVVEPMVVVGRRRERGVSPGPIQRDLGVACRSSSSANYDDLYFWPKSNRSQIRQPLIGEQNYQYFQIQFCKIQTLSHQLTIGSLLVLNRLECKDIIHRPTAAMVPSPIVMAAALSGLLSFASAQATKAPATSHWLRFVGYDKTPPL